MKKPALALLAATAGILAGCASTPLTPPSLSHVALTNGDSPLVRVSSVRLERKDEKLILRGYVLRQFEARDTTPTHLDVTLFDGAGNALKRMTGNFEPRQIPRRPRMPDSAAYTIPLDTLPPETARIDVQAHEGNHPQL